MTTEEIAGLADWARVFDALGVPLAERAGIETQIEMLSHAWFKADTIRSLVTELLALREAVKPFAKAADIRLRGDFRDDERFGHIDLTFHLTFGDLRRAARALSHPEPMK